jgi:cellulose synthase operon protein YhjQ
VVILSVVSAKGGVGKTTLAASLASGLSDGRNVVSVDLDPQNALRLHLGVAVSETDGIGRATLEQRNWQSCMFRSARSGPYILPYGALNESDRDAFEVHLSSHPQWLMNGLNGLGLGASDLVVIDTPPGPSLYQQQALRAAHFVLVVIHADAASYATLPSMEGLLERYCEGREGFHGAAYLLNAVPAGSALSRDVVRVVRAGLGERMVPVIVHQDESVREALACDQLVAQYAVHSEATSDIGQVVRWLNQRLTPVFHAQGARNP